MARPVLFPHRMHQRGHRFRLLVQHLAGGGHLRHQRGILLSHLFELIQRLLDLRHAERLLLRGVGDIADVLPHLPGVAHRRLQRAV